MLSRPIVCSLQLNASSGGNECIRATCPNPGSHRMSPRRIKPVQHALVLGISLALFWLLLSGHYTGLLLALGVVSVALVMYLALRMDRVDGERQPLHVPPMLITYWAWHFAEIAKCNIDVARRIVNPNLPISPTVVRVRAGQHSPIAKATYANSITLTPGTVTLRVEGDEFHVHALSREGAKDLESGEMERRVRKAFEDKAT